MTLEELTKNKIIINGKIAYSHITRVTTNEELMRMNMRSEEQIKTPHTMITISEATLVPQNEHNLTDMEKMLITDIAVKDSETEQKHFIARNMTENLPKTFVKTDNGYEETKIEREPDAGLDITLLLSEDATLESIIFNEPIRYYGARIPQFTQNLPDSLNEFFNRMNNRG